MAVWNVFLRNHFWPEAVKRRKGDKGRKLKPPPLQTTPNRNQRQTTKISEVLNSNAKKFEARKLFQNYYTMQQLPVAAHCGSKPVMITAECRPSSPHFARYRISAVTACETLTNSFMTYHAIDFDRYPISPVLWFFFFILRNQITFSHLKIFILRLGLR